MQLERDSLIARMSRSRSHPQLGRSTGAPNATNHWWHAKFMDGHVAGSRADRAARDRVASRADPVEALDDRKGADVSVELGGRLFLRYLTDSQVTDFNDGSSRPHWVTPTPITSEDLVHWLALFAPTIRRVHALILDPAKVNTVRGPAWIRLGLGIEYYLPDGFDKEAIVDAGVIQVR